MKEGRTYKIVHYLNQFFAKLGGEDNAGMAPLSLEGSVGPGRYLEQVSGARLEIMGTVICGDNYFVEREEALERILELIKKYKPEAFFAGPAFLAGRYGEACAAVSLAVQERMGIPVITGMALEHPSVERYKQKIPIYQTGSNAADMKRSLPGMVEILLKRLEGKNLLPEEQERLIKQGLKKNSVKDTIAAERAIQMLLKKYRGEAWQSEMPIPFSEKVPPAKPVAGTGFKVALITDGGLMLQGNPEGMPSGRCERWYSIDISSWSKLSKEEIEVNHLGYDNRYVADDPNRLVALDRLRKLEEAGNIVLHPIMYSTAGAVTALENCARFGKEIARELINRQVQAAILTST